MRWPGAWDMYNIGYARARPKMWTGRTSQNCACHDRSNARIWPRQHTAGVTMSGLRLRGEILSETLYSMEVLARRSQEGCIPAVRDCRAASTSIRWRSSYLHTDRATGAGRDHFGQRRAEDSMGVMDLEPSPTCFGRVLTLKLAMAQRKRSPCTAHST